VSAGHATKSCETSLKKTLQWSGMGLPAEVSSYPKGQANTRVAMEESSRLHQLQQVACRECRPQNPRLKLWAVLEDTVCQKHHYSLDSLRRSHVKAAADLPGDRSVQ